MRVSIPALRPLRFRDFRLLWTGLAVSLVGDGMWLVAIAFQVIALDGGPVQLSLIATTYSLGLVGFMLPAGVVADRLPRRLVMFSADIVRAFTVAAIGVLSLTGTLELWHMAIGGALIGAGEAFFIPSYTALLPRLLPEDELLAANGLEGMLRPLAQQAAGPLLGGVVVAVLEPGAAILGATGTYLISAGCLAAMRVSSGPDRSAHERPTAVADLVEAARYVKRTPWLWATLVYACVAVFFLLGPLEVLAPFVIRDRAGGGSAEYGILLACFGAGAAIGALAISSRSMPRRYLSVMLWLWGAGTLPLAVLGIANELWIMCAAVLIVGATESAATVIWGTLLQRRVPDGLRGRVSSLDFFVSLALLPASMALAGPAAEAFGLTAVFVAAALISGLGAPIAFRAGRLGRDELAHPLS